MASPREHLARHYVIEAQRIVTRQRRLIAKAVNGHSFREAELLVIFEKSLALFEDDLATVTVEASDTGRTV
jgi:hypothetical protein